MSAGFYRGVDALGADRATQLSHQPMDELGREASRGKKARLRRALGGVAWWRDEAPGANRGCPRHLGLGQMRREFRRQGQGVLRQLALDPLVAEAGLARMDARLDEPLARQEPVRLEPVEQRLDLRRGYAVAARFLPRSSRR